MCSVEQHLFAVGPLLSMEVIIAKKFKSPRGSKERKNPASQRAEPGYDLPLYANQIINEHQQRRKRSAVETTKWVRYDSTAAGVQWNC